MKRSRIGIVDALSFAGREFSRALAGSDQAPAEVVLLDRSQLEGTLTEYDGEPLVLQTLTGERLEELDGLVICGAGDLVQPHLPRLLATHCPVLDLVGALPRDPDSDRIVLPPLLSGSAQGRGVLRLPSSEGMLIATVLAEFRDVGEVLGADAVVFEPVVSEGEAGIDALHQQTVAALNLQSIAAGALGTRIAFDVVPVAGAGAKSREELLQSEIRAILLGEAPPLTATVLRVPVFLGYAALMTIELDDVFPEASLQELLAESGRLAMSVRPLTPGDLGDTPEARPTVSLLPSDGRGRVRLWVVVDGPLLRTAAALAVISSGFPA